MAALGELRVTHMVFPDMKRDTLQHNWRDKHSARVKTRSKWTGRSIFSKAEAPASDGAVVEGSGLPIRPGSTLALRAGLAGMRSELAAAQRQDPRLKEIIE